MDRRLASDGLTTQQAALLTIAERDGEHPTQGEVAEALGVSHQNVRQLITALTRKGLLDVQVDQKDQRVRRLSATPTARTIFASRDADDFKAVASWFEDLSDDEVTVLMELLRRLALSVKEERAV